MSIAPIGKFVGRFVLVVELTLFDLNKHAVVLLLCLAETRDVFGSKKLDQVMLFYVFPEKDWCVQTLSWV